MSQYSPDERETLTRALVKIGFSDHEADSIATAFVERESRRVSPHTAA